MRQKPKLQDTKLKTVLKSRVSVLGRANVDTAKRKRTKITSSRLATCRSKLKGHSIKPQKRQRRTRDQTASIAKRMAELHLPFLTPTEGHSLSDAEILTKLRWSTLEMGLENYGVWEDTTPSPVQDAGSDRYPKENRPQWNALPKVRPDQAIGAYVQRLYRTCRREPGLQIPGHWPIFSSVNWDQNHLFPSITDSSNGRIRTCRSSPPPCERIGKKSGLQQEARIQCHMRSIQQPRIRMQWQLMHSMQPSWFKWRHQTEVRPKSRNIGFLDQNQRSPNSDIWPQTAISAFLRPLRNKTDYFYPEIDLLSETRSLARTGQLIVDMVATDAFPSQSRESLNWPPFLSQGMQTPTIDYTCRARHVNFGQHEKWQPLLFGAQRVGERPLQAFEQMAMAFQPMMTLFILYYLDTRTNVEEPMPDWMVLFGAIYNADGLVVQAYHPSFNLLATSVVDSERTRGWGACSTGLCYAHSLKRVMTREPWHRGPPLEVLRGIQGHCNVVLEHLQKWDGYDRACQRISLGLT